MVRQTVLRELDPLDSLRLSGRWVYEADESAWLQGFLRPGDVFIDVGAHVGYYSVMAGKIVGPKGRVYAFEPNFDLFKILLGNVDGLPVRCYNAAVVGPELSQQNIKLVRNPKNTGDSWLEIDEKNAEPLFSVQLDRFFPLFHEPKIRTIKIDTQGLEFDILEGAGLILRLVDSLIVEVYPLGLSRYSPDCSNSPTAERIFSLAISGGYGLYSVRGVAAGGHPSRLSLEEALSMTPAGKGHWNVLLLRQESRP